MIRTTDGIDIHVLQVQIPDTNYKTYSQHMKFCTKRTNTVL